VTGPLSRVFGLLFGVAIRRALRLENAGFKSEASRQTAAVSGLWPTARGEQRAGESIPRGGPSAKRRQRPDPVASGAVVVRLCTSDVHMRTTRIMRARD